MERAPTVRSRSVPITGDPQGLAFLAEPGAPGAVCPPPAYRPRHPERTAFYQVFEEHFDRYVEVHEERYEPRDGPLRPVVRPTVEAFLDCGRLESGFARIRCPTCKAEFLLALT